MAGGRKQTADGRWQWQVVNGNDNGRGRQWQFGKAFVGNEEKWKRGVIAVSKGQELELKQHFICSILCSWMELFNSSAMERRSSS